MTGMQNHELPLNQTSPTDPGTKVPDVGWALTLASINLQK
jgi:hypothetical protein